MKTVKISLNSIDKVKAFVNEVTKYDAEFDLVSGRYVIDAKSIMGIFSLDLSKPIDLNIHSENNIDEILAKTTHRPTKFYSGFTQITSRSSIAFFTISSIFSAKFFSDSSIFAISGFVTGCFATKIVQQSSNG